MVLCKGKKGYLSESRVTGGRFRKLKGGHWVKHLRERKETVGFIVKRKRRRTISTYIRKERDKETM